MRVKIVFDLRPVFRVELGPTVTSPVFFERVEQWNFFRHFAQHPYELARVAVAQGAGDVDEGWVVQRSQEASDGAFERWGGEADVSDGAAGDVAVSVENLCQLAHAGERDWLVGAVHELKDI
ncbi:hypothetical protein D3C76_1235800 [compost metagenome]